MAQTPVPIARWIDSVVKATEEVATVSLGCEELRRLEADPSPAAPYGAYLPVIADLEKLHLGLLLTEKGGQSLTRSLLAMEPDEEDPPLEDVADAVGEIVNILAGVMQRDLVGEVKSFELGLPKFVNGEIVQHQSLSSVRINVGFDDTPAQLVVLGRNPDDPKGADDGE